VRVCNVHGTAPSKTAVHCAAAIQYSASQRLTEIVEISNGA